MANHRQYGLRKHWQRLLLALAAAALATTSQADGLASARDLAADAARASAVGAPVLIFYKTDSCPYCHHVEDLYLEPMQQRDTYAGRLVIRVVHADKHQPLRDFQGNLTDHSRFASRQGAWFTPLIQLYGADGAVLAPPLIGYTSPDFYAGELESRIEAAIGRLRSANAAQSTPTP